MILQKNVLVFPCGSEIGLEVYNSLRNSAHFKIFGLSSIDDNGKFIYENYISNIVFYNEYGFIDSLNKVIKDYKIDIIYPTMDSVISFLKQNEIRINAAIVGSNADTSMICESKLRTYKLLDNVVKCPKIFNNVDEIDDFPLFTKPIIGYGSRGAFKVNNIRDLENIDLSAQLLLEFLPGEEVTVDCFTDLNRKLIYVGARKRLKTLNGISISTITDTELSNKFIDIATKINESILFEGSWFFQMKEDCNGIFTLLEVASRFAGSSSVQRIKGANFALANLYLKLNHNVSFLVNTFNVELSRSLDSKYFINITYNSIYIDLDDTIIINGKINIDAISLLFNAMNQNKKIILLTKHAGNLTDTITKYKINNIFDKIIHISQNNEKYQFIDIKENPIFIDDSFIERKKIFEYLSIPVFGVDAIKSLL